MRTFLKHEIADGVYRACIPHSFMYLASVERRAFIFMLLLFQLPQFKLIGNKQPMFEH